MIFLKASACRKSDLKFTERVKGCEVKFTNIAGYTIYVRL